LSARALGLRKATCRLRPEKSWASAEGPGFDSRQLHLVIQHCDLFGQTVEREFEHIQNWYHSERFAADPGLHDLITSYRTPGAERAIAQ
jgi:hypothetical protein